MRQIAPTPASLVVEDVRPDGRALLQTLSLKARMLVKTPADADERDLSWFDFPLLRDMSADGGTILFDEEGEGGGPSYSVFVRRTNGAPAIRIGDGYALRLSPDLQSALTSAPSGPPNALTLTIMPIGAGEPRKVIVPLETSGLPRWFPDGKRLAVVGNEPGRPNRSYEYAVEHHRRARGGRGGQPATRRAPAPIDPRTRVQRAARVGQWRFPPFGKKSSVTIVNEAGDQQKESLVINRDDFWATTSNKQLAGGAGGAGGGSDKASSVNLSNVSYRPTIRRR